MSEKDERRWRHNFYSHGHALSLWLTLEAFYSWCISIMVIAHVFIAWSSFLNIVDDQQISTIEPDPKYKHTQ